MKKDLMLKQSNNLILATHRMTLQQMRLFFYACSQYKGDLSIDVTLDEINRVLAYQGGEQRELLKNAIPTLMSSALIHLEDESGERWSVAITDSYITKDNKTVRFTFNKTVQKELEELRGYTWLYLSNLTNMSSTYAIRLYEFFAMRLGATHQKETFDYDINKLRAFLDCTDKYKRFDLFDQRVIQGAIKQINNKTNINVTYKKNKQGRTITSIRFSFSWKKKDNEVIDQQENDDDFNDFLKNELPALLEKYEGEEK